MQKETIEESSVATDEAISIYADLTVSDSQLNRYKNMYTYMHTVQLVGFFQDVNVLYI